MLTQVAIDAGAKQSGIFESSMAWPSMDWPRVQFVLSPVLFVLSPIRLATETGLVRFDGLRFEPFRSPFGDQLLCTGVYALFAPPSGGLWIGYQFGIQLREPRACHELWNRIWLANRGCLEFCSRWGWNCMGRHNERSVEI